MKRLLLALLTESTSSVVQVVSGILKRKGHCYLVVGGFTSKATPSLALRGSPAVPYKRMPRGTHPRRVGTADKRCCREALGLLSCIREGKERSPAFKKPISQSAFKLLVHDFVQRRRPYRGFRGSRVPMFPISYVE